MRWSRTPPTKPCSRAGGRSCTASIADALRGEFAAVAAAEPELVAHHLTQAGLDEPAIEWWGKAGDQALRRYAFKEAAAHLGKAIELADKLAATAPSAAPGINRLRLQTSLGNALMWAKGNPASETSAAFARARELASREEDASERFSAYYGLWAGHFTRGEPAPLREMAELFLREATARLDCPEALVAHRLSGITCLYFGDFVGAHDHFRTTIELYDPARHGDFANRFGNDPRAAAEVFDAIALWVLGRVDEALPLADRALADAESAAHAPTMGLALAFTALLGFLRYNPEAVATYGQGLADIVSRYDLSRLGRQRDIFSGLDKVVARRRRGGAGRDAERHRHFSGARFWLGLGRFRSGPWLKPKRAPARPMPGSGAWAMRSPSSRPLNAVGTKRRCTVSAARSC